jgi:hypothetical protein
MAVNLVGAFKAFTDYKVGWPLLCVT